VTPEWLMSQDADTISILAEQAEKVLDSDAKYKSVMLQVMSKKAF
jgi:hypothetical protein